ncbi:flagellar basal body P-ring formation chaperone FlgA [Hyphococcus lacteus]|uniref:Flagella basal body P-ring formation protein FlgA n=1 Tax=Hyphococcus lacteus TaxID=3143536 RepID=A0ABV3Z7A9_9PROT
MKNTFAFSVIIIATIISPFASAADVSSTPFVDGSELPIIATTIPEKNNPPVTSPAPQVSDVPVVKAINNLRAGVILHQSDLMVENGDPGILSQYVGKEMKRAVYAGKAISQSDVGPATIIERNAIVSLEFVRGPLVIMTEGRALDAGAMGEGVRVMNLSSKIILTAVVTGPNQARTR